MNVEKRILNIDYNYKRDKINVEIPAYLINNHLLLGNGTERRNSLSFLGSMCCETIKLLQIPESSEHIPLYWEVLNEGAKFKGNFTPINLGDFFSESQEQIYDAVATSYNNLNPENPKIDGLARVLIKKLRLDPFGKCSRRKGIIHLN